MPQNLFKSGISTNQTQFGLWCTLSSSFAIEVVAGAGYDWLLLDTEHAPGDPLTVLPQLQVIAGYPGLSAVARPAANDTVLIKRFLDAGAQSLLIPYVETAEEARAAVRAMRYPPHGIRGVSSVTRATGFGREANYFERAQDELCLIIQIETKKALENLEDIASVEGVDGLFVGPADLGASLGFAANQKHPDLRAIVLDTIRKIKKSGKPAGLLTLDPTLQNDALAAGVNFLALGVDAAVLARSVEGLLSEAKALHLSGLSA